MWLGFCPDVDWHHNALWYIVRVLCEDLVSPYSYMQWVPSFLYNSLSIEMSHEMYGRPDVVCSMNVCMLCSINPCCTSLDPSHQHAPDWILSNMNVCSHWLYIMIVHACSCDIITCQWYTHCSTHSVTTQQHWSIMQSELTKQSMRECTKRRQRVTDVFL